MTFEEDFPSLKDKLQETKGFDLVKGLPALMLWPGEVRKHTIDKHNILKAIENCTFITNPNHIRKDEFLKELGL